MDQRTKAWLIVASLVLTVGVLSIRYQSPVFILSFLIGIGISFLYPKIGIPITAIQAILLYPGANMGFLYGRDSVSLASIANEISQNGWSLPLEVKYIWGDPTTPIIHLLIVIGSKITGLGIVPASNAKFLFSSLVPIISISITLLIVWKMINRQTQSVIMPMPILPILLWVPLFRFYTGVRRGTLSILFVAILLFLASRLRDDPRMLGIIGIVGVTLPATHHVGLTFGLFLILALGTVYPKLRYMAITLAILATLWYAWVTTRAVLAVGFLTALLGWLPSIGSVSTTETSILETLASLFLQLELVVLALGFSLILVRDILNRQTKEIDLGLFLFSGLVGIVTLNMYLGGKLAWPRPATYFIIGASWIPIVRFHQALDGKVRIRKTVGSMFVIFLVITAGLQIEPHIVSQTQPDYNQGETDQRFRGMTYAAGEWSSRYIQGTVIGDANTIEVVVPASQVDGKMAGPGLVRAKLSPANTALISGRNNYLIKSQVNGTWFSLNTDSNLRNRYDWANNNIYSNGWINAYQQPEAQPH